MIELTLIAAGLFIGFQLGYGAAMRKATRDLIEVNRRFGGLLDGKGDEC